MTATKQMMTIDDVSSVFQAREFAYDFLRRAFIEEPSKDYLDVLTQKNLMSIFPFQEESEGVKEAVSTIKKYLIDYQPAKIVKNYDALHWDYTKMFIGPFDLLASPWESSYVHHDGLLFQETTLDMRKKYEKFGFKLEKENVEAEDHIGLELDFIFHLNKLAIISSQEGSHTTVHEILYLLKEQKEFIEDHFNKFVPQLAKKMIEHAETDFYKGVAMLLESFIKIDSQVLHELLNIEIVSK